MMHDSGPPPVTKKNWLDIAKLVLVGIAISPIYVLAIIVAVLFAALIIALLLPILIPVAVVGLIYGFCIGMKWLSGKIFGKTNSSEALDISPGYSPTNSRCGEEEEKVVSLQQPNRRSFFWNGVAEFRAKVGATFLV